MPLGDWEGGAFNTLIISSKTVAKSTKQVPLAYFPPPLNLSKNFPALSPVSERRFVGGLMPSLLNRIKNVPQSAAACNPPIPHLWISAALCIYRVYARLFP